jgi:hypothetical protein
MIIFVLRVPFYAPFFPVLSSPQRSSLPFFLGAVFLETLLAADFLGAAFFFMGVVLPSQVTGLKPTF